MNVFVDTESHTQNVRDFHIFCLFLVFLLYSIIYYIGTWPHRLAIGSIDLAFLPLTMMIGTKDRRNSRRTEVEQ
jgi:hypothetical protein